MIGILRLRVSDARQLVGLASSARCVQPRRLAREEPRDYRSLGEDPAFTSLARAGSARAWTLVDLRPSGRSRVPSACASRRSALETLTLCGAPKDMVLDVRRHTDRSVHRRVGDPPLLRSSAPPLAERREERDARRCAPRSASRGAVTAPPLRRHRCHPELHISPAVSGRALRTSVRGPRGRDGSRGEQLERPRVRVPPLPGMMPPSSLRACFGRRNRHPRASASHSRQSGSERRHPFFDVRARAGVASVTR